MKLAGPTHQYTAAAAVAAEAASDTVSTRSLADLQRAPGAARPTDS